MIIQMIRQHFQMTYEYDIYLILYQDSSITPPPPQTTQNCTLNKYLYIFLYN